MIKAILFDLNGVIVDSEGLNISTWHKLFQEFGVEFDLKKYRYQIDGKTTEEVAKVLGVKNQEAFICRKDEIWFQLYKSQGVEIFNDVPSVLQKLRKNGINCGIISSSRKANIILRDKGLLGCFDVVVCGNDVKRGKPFPDVIIKAMQLLGVKENETIVIEDSIAGVQAASAASVACYMVCRDGTMEDSYGRIKYIESLHELEKQIGRS